MEENRLNELRKLTIQYFNVAASHVDQNLNLNEELLKAIKGRVINEDAEIPAFEKKPMKFGDFQNREFVSMMTDIRKSTDIINGPNGTTSMFLIFYIYAGIVAKIVDYHGGTSTEFLGDGVLNLFDTEEFNLDGALQKSVMASWDILEARNKVLNPFFSSVGLPNINFGIGIDHGLTIVTRFGYRGDTDLKAFGKCVYNSSKLCKGMNQIFVSQKSQSVWPVAPNGKLGFNNPQRIDGVVGVPLYIKQ